MRLSVRARRASRLYCWSSSSPPARKTTGVEVKDLSFSGNEAVTTVQLKSVLATAESARLPWGQQEYFTREEFDADLKRIVAYYRDRGYPDARVRVVRCRGSATIRSRFA